MYIGDCRQFVGFYFVQYFRQDLKNIARFHCTNHSDKPLRAKIMSAKASMIFVSYLHCAKSESGYIFQVLALLRKDKSFPLFQGVYVFIC